MGRDKALVTVGVEETPLIARVERALSEAAGEILLATSDPEPYAFLGRAHVADARPDAGPLGGLVAGLEALARHEIVCVVACDLPFVTSDAFRALSARLREAPHVDAVVPTTEKGDEPLLAAYRPRAARALRRALEAGRLAVHEAISEIVVQRAPAESIAPECAFWNVNDPQCLHEASLLEARSA